MKKRETTLSFNKKWDTPEKEDTREVIDIKELNKEIVQIVSKQNRLRTAIDEIVADIEGVS